jgi:hypothetical protein
MYGFYSHSVSFAHKKFVAFEFFRAFARYTNHGMVKIKIPVRLFPYREGSLPYTVPKSIIQSKHTPHSPQKCLFSFSTTSDTTLEHFDYLLEK